MIEYLLILDFEATCGPSVPKTDAEIIEFPVVVVSIQEKKIIDQFQRYVRPTLHPNLDSFCTELTGITQNQVDPSDVLPNVLKEATDFCRKYADNGIFVTCGEWDLRTMLPMQAERENIQYDEMFRRYVNIKKVFMNHYGLKKQKDMVGMLAMKDIALDGRHHSGIDDSKNIAKIALRLIFDGYKFTT